MEPNQPNLPPILKKFARLQEPEPESCNGLTGNRFGAYFRKEFCQDLEQGLSLQGEDLFETLFLAEAILNAHSDFTMLELGCGFARWLATAAMMIIHNRPELRLRLLGIEADPIHAEWAAQTMQDNRVDPLDYEILNCALVPDKRKYYLKIFRPKFKTLQKAPRVMYGQNIISSEEVHRQKQSEKTIQDTYAGEKVSYLQNGVGVIAVKNTCRLKELLARYPSIDLIDCDLQGIEADLLEQNAKEIDQKVKAVYIGTHSNEIDKRLCSLFKDLQWKNRFFFSSFSEHKSFYGQFYANDGISAWINPKLVSSWPTMEQS